MGTGSTKGMPPYTTFDVYAAAYHSLHGAEVTMRLEGSKVMFMIARNDLERFHEIQDQYADNEPVRVKDYTHEVKMMRVRMQQCRHEGRDLGGI